MGRPPCAAASNGDRRDDDESELLAYFDFSDLIQVVSTSDRLLDAVGQRSRAAWEGYAGGLVALRHEVMHPVRNSVIAKGGLIRLHQREQRIRALVERLDERDRPRDTLRDAVDLSGAANDVA